MVVVDVTSPFHGERIIMKKPPELLAPGTYRHYKGKLYEVIGIARHSETEEELVVYRTLYGNYDLWVRPRAMFLENVEVNGQQIPRFSLLKDDQKPAP
jgi:hypothetical protein